MSEQPLVSVVIPAYNAARTLKETVRSVFEQTVQNFEIVIVDDGSKDDTIAVAESIQDARVRVIAQPNGGASVARNTGLKAARGEFVALLDADDLWMPHKLERQLAVLNGEKDVNAVQTGAYYVNDALEVLSVRPCFESKNALLETLRFQNMPGVMSSLLIRREAFKKIGYFNTDLLMIEDWEMMIRVARFGNLKSLPEPLFLYRFHVGNRSVYMGDHIAAGYKILDDFFKDETLPPDIKKNKNLAYSALNLMLCGGAFNVGRFGEAFKWGTKATLAHISALKHIAALPLRKLKRNSSREIVPPEYKLFVENFLKVQV
jgi:glycosyltransferase involved in cell wall biosynthesis